MQRIGRAAVSRAIRISSRSPVISIVSYVRISDKKSVDPFPDPPVPEVDADGLMVPPWMKFPNIPLGSIGWHMGIGEDYWDRFSRWYNKQARSTHKRLWAKYPYASKENHPLQLLLKSTIQALGD